MCSGYTRDCFRISLRPELGGPGRTHVATVKLCSVVENLGDGVIDPIDVYERGIV